MAEKTEKKSGGGQIIKLALVLFAVSAIMALALGLIYEVTKDTIAMRAAETTKNAYANVLPADDYAEQADFENDGTITKLSVATTGGEQTGYVALAIQTRLQCRNELGHALRELIKVERCADRKRRCPRRILIGMHLEHLRIDLNRITQPMNQLTI